MAKKYLDIVKEIFLDMLKNDSVKIVLFGSRASGNSSAVSDIDVGIISNGEFDKKKITLLREILEKINIPYKVDIVDFDEVSEEFKQKALEGSIIWKN